MDFRVFRAWGLGFSCRRYPTSFGEDCVCVSYLLSSQQPIMYYGLEANKPLR